LGDVAVPSVYPKHETSAQTTQALSVSPAVLARTGLNQLPRHPTSGVSKLLSDTRFIPGV